MTAALKYYCLLQSAINRFIIDIESEELSGDD